MTASDERPIPFRFLTILSAVVGVTISSMGGITYWLSSLQQEYRRGLDSLRLEVKKDQRDLDVRIRAIEIYSVRDRGSH